MIYVIVYDFSRFGCPKCPSLINANLPHRNLVRNMSGRSPVDPGASEDFFNNTWELGEDIRREAHGLAFGEVMGTVVPTPDLSPEVKSFVQPILR